MNEQQRRHAAAIRSARFVERYGVAIGFAVFFGLPVIVAIILLALGL